MCESNTQLDIALAAGCDLAGTWQTPVAGYGAGTAVNCSTMRLGGHCAVVGTMQVNHESVTLSILVPR